LTYHYFTSAKGNCDTFNGATQQSYIYRYILPILGLDVTIDDLAYPESEDSEPFIIGELEFLQLVISYETQAAALMSNEAAAVCLWAVE